MTTTTTATTMAHGGTTRSMVKRRIYIVGYIIPLHMCVHTYIYFGMVGIFQTHVALTPQHIVYRRHFLQALYMVEDLFDIHKPWPAL